MATNKKKLAINGYKQTLIESQINTAIEALDKAKTNLKVNRLRVTHTCILMASNAIRKAKSDLIEEAFLLVENAGNLYNSK